MAIPMGHTGSTVFHLCLFVHQICDKSFKRSKQRARRIRFRVRSLPYIPSRYSSDFTVVAQLVVPTTGSLSNLLQTCRRLSRQQIVLFPPRLASQSLTINLLPPQSSPHPSGRKE